MAFETRSVQNRVGIFSDRRGCDVALRLSRVGIHDRNARQNRDKNNDHNLNYVRSQSSPPRINSVNVSQHVGLYTKMYLFGHALF